MAEGQNSPPASKPRAVQTSSSSDASRPRSPTQTSVSTPADRASSIARLATSPTGSNSTPIASNKADTGGTAPLAGAGGPNHLPGPGQSALAAALQGAFGRSPPRFGTPPVRPSSPSNAGVPAPTGEQRSNYGSFETRFAQGAQGRASPVPKENAEIVKRHLVQSSDIDGSDEGARSGRESHRASNSNLRHGRTTGNQTGLNDDEFSSLQLQGGDMTREVYRWAEDAEAQSQGGRGKRSHSFHISRPQPESDELDISSIKIPGGFRRNYLQRQAPSPSPVTRMRNHGLGGYKSRHQTSQPRALTSNFIEFLTLYGHFAGEELEEDDEVLKPGEYFAYDDEDEEEGDDSDLDEDRALLTPDTPGRRKRRRKEWGATGTSTPLQGALLLLKSFVGTGVLFLPKAFLNGGMLFSSLTLIGVAAITYYCFILLVRTQEKVGGSYGDLGGALYGKRMRAVILVAIALSQVGFVAAYTIFTAENLQAFVLAVSKCRTWIDIKYMVLMQLVVFLPLSLIRDISKLGFTALIADAFILLGLIYLAYYDVRTIVVNHGAADIENFNPRDWTLFVGTAIFTFEGIGLIIPIKEAMKQPSKFPFILAVVMVIVTVVYTGMGALSYAAFGSATKTVVLLNLPQDDKFVNAVQLLYSLAILLSTPLQLFPAIRITENGLFTQSGKHHPYIKWKKNIFRFLFVAVCAVIAWAGAADLDKFVALVGSFACVPLVFIFPSILHLKAVARTRSQQVADVALCIVGVFVMVYTTTLTIKSWINGSNAKGPGYCDR